MLLRNGKLATEALSGTKMDFPEIGNTTVEDPSGAPLIYSIKSLNGASGSAPQSSYLLPKALRHSLLWHPGS